MFYYEAYVSERKWTGERVEQSTVAAEHVISLLEQHHQRLGRYPESLGELTPVDPLPRPSAGNPKWGYQLLDDSGQAYELAFYANRDLYPSKTYDSRSKEWALDQ